MENHLDNFDWDSFNISYTDDLKADTVNVTNLSSQIERNNKLLNYIQEQEDRFLNSQNYVKKLEEGFSQTQESCRIAHERSEDLHNKLKLSSELCDQLTSQVREIRHEGQNLNLSLESERTINTTLRTRNSFLENNQNTLTLHIQHLQNELLRVQDDNKKTNMEVLQSESSMHQTMEELALTNRINSDLINDNNIKQNYIIELKDKNLQLIQHYERIISNYNSVSDAMNISQHQIDNSRQKERVEQQSISDMEMYISELEENLAICNSKLHQLEQQRLEDVEKCNKTDLLWRQLEVSYFDR
jgi:chromosome segregation ATPase